MPQHNPGPDDEVILLGWLMITSVIAAFLAYVAVTVLDGA